MKRAAGDARKSTASATSAGAPGAPLGTADAAKPRMFSIEPKNREPISVSIGPGETAFTRTPLLMNSMAAVRVSVATAPLLAAYTVVPAMPMSAATELLLTIAPRDFFKCGSACSLPVTIFGMFHHGSRGSAAIHATLEFLARELPRRTKMRAVERTGRAREGA